MKPSERRPAGFFPPAAPQACSENIVQSGNIRITVLGSRLFRVEIDSFSDEASQAVWFRNAPPTVFRVYRDEAFLQVQTEDVLLSVCRACFSDSWVRFSDGSCAPLDGSGNLRGTCRTLDVLFGKLVVDPSVKQFDREHIPLQDGVCSRSGAAVYDDSSSLLLHADGTLTPREGGTDRYVFAYGHNYPAAVQALYRLCGPQPSIPRWALGNWWSRYHAYTQQEYQNLMDEFAVRNIPVSVAVLDMDWHYVNVEQEFSYRKPASQETALWPQGWTGYTWNKHLFPNHRQLLDELHKRGMHVTLNLHPALGVRPFEAAYSEMAAALGMDPSEKKEIPFAIQQPRFAAAYLQYLHHPLEEEGIDFWWIDWQQGTDTGVKGLDPLWLLNHYHYYDSANRHGTGLILSRFAGIGSHRYPLGFSGDTVISWEFLDYMPYFTATAANAGYGWWSHDIGGHMDGMRDEELYLRWLQFGVWSPINRLHCCEKETISKEPWTLTGGNSMIAAHWLRLRHQLIPWLHTLNLTGALPIVQPMYYRWPEQDAAYEANHQYMLGSLLVAPITTPSQQDTLAVRTLWLPRGRWTDLFTGQQYTGDRWITVCRDLDQMPVFLPEGCILPLDAAPDNSCKEPDAMQLLVTSGSGQLDMKETEQTTVFAARMLRENEQLVTVSAQSKPRRFHVFFMNVTDGVCTLSVDGEEQDLLVRHNRCLQALFTLAPGQSACLRASWVPECAADRCLRRLLALLIRLPADNDWKQQQWLAVCREHKKNKLVRWAQDLPAAPAHRTAFLETITAEAF